MPSARHRSPVRQLKMLVVILILSNVALGSFGFYFLRALDRKYSSLITQTVPVMGELERVAASGVQVMRGTNPAVYQRSSQDQAQMISRAREDLARDSELSNQLVENDSLSFDSADRINFRDAAETFHNQAAQVIDLLVAGKMYEASQLRDQSLRSAFERYLAAAGKSAEVLKTQSLKASNTLSAQTGSVSEIILGVAGWPLFALGALLFAVIVIILLIRIFLFSGQESTT
jgi:hypothetical protein